MSGEIYIVMGVSGCGKSTVGRALAEILAVPFQEGDLLHPPANIAKMSAGIALTDEDRWPWLRLCKSWIEARLRAGEGGVLACSALKRAYRDFLVAGRPQLRIVYLRVPVAVLTSRLAARHGHFMPGSLLESQLATLEEPDTAERPIIPPVAASEDEIVEFIIREESTSFCEQKEAKKL